MSKRGSGHNRYHPDEATTAKGESGGDPLELGIPVKYIGVGETIDDLQKFNADEFVNALFDVKANEERN